MNNSAFPKRVFPAVRLPHDEQSVCAISNRRCDSTHNDDFAPARGLMNGLAISAVFWLFVFKVFA